MKALTVIIDPQKDFINIDGAYNKRLSGIDQILKAKENINSLMRLDPQEKLIVVSNYRANQFAEGLSICIAGTEGHKTDIIISHETQIIEKKEHSCFSSVEFCDLLKKKSISKVVLCGFLAEYCVKQTALDALKNNYKVVLLKDLIGTGDDVQERMEETFRELRQAGAEII